jgi:predicted membrane protein
MPLLDIVVTLVVVGVLLWLINRFSPMASSIKTILNVVVVIAVIWWLLSILGFVQSMSTIRLG